MKHFKRALPLILAVAMVLTMVPVPQANAVSASGASAQKVTAQGMHPFTGTEDLIQDAIQDLRDQGKTMEPNEADEALVASVEKASDMTYDQVKASLATALTTELDSGSIDVAALGLSKEDMSAVLQEVLFERYLYNAVTELTYTTAGGVVTEVGFSVSDGYASAMDAIKAESMDVQLQPTVDTLKVNQTMTDKIGTGAELHAEGDEEGGEEGEEEPATCTNHTVGSKKILGDLNNDETLNVRDTRDLRSLIAEDQFNEQGDINGDGALNVRDTRDLRQMIANDEIVTMQNGGVSFTWAETVNMNPDPQFRMDAEGNYLDSEGNITDDPNEAISNGGLIYNPETGEILQGLLPEVYFELTQISFYCSVCGQEIVIADVEATEESEGFDVHDTFTTVQDVYINMNTYDTVLVDVGEVPTPGEGETAEDYMHYTEMQIATYTDDTFSIMLNENGTPITDENGDYIPVYEMDEEGNPVLDENGNVIIPGMFNETQDNGSAEVAYYYSQMSAFNADNADYYGISTDFWTSKNSEANPMAAVKYLCNIDPETDVPPAQMLQLVQMLPQAFMAYVMYYANELDAMRDAAMAAVDALPDGATNIQKLLVIHDWLAENAVFDMGSMLNVSETGGNNDPIQMTTFGAMLSNQLTQMQNSDYYGGICLSYAAAYAYLVQNAFPEYYQDADGNWLTPEGVDNNGKGGDIVDFGQVMFYADTAETSIAGEGFGGGTFNNVHYWNMVRLPEAPTSTVEDDEMTGNWFFVDACYDDIYVECLTQYRAEAEGSVYHNYFLVSPQTMAQMWGSSVDYIDCLYDGYTYVVETDENGDPVPSDNVDPESPNYDPEHYNYVKVENSDEQYNNNTCYEDSWFSGAVSKIYNDGTNWYYVDSGSNVTSYSDMMDEEGNIDMDTDQMEQNGLNMDQMMHSSRVGKDSQDKLKSRPMTAPDYWEDPNEDESTDNGMTVDMTTKEDTYASVLFDYGTGLFYTKNLDENGEQIPVEGIDLSAAIIEDFNYNEQFPGLTHTIGLYNNSTLYFNLGNQIHSYDLTASTHQLVKEYNTVKATSDGRIFGASSYTLDASGTDLEVENNPIAALAIRTAYTPLYNYVDAEGNVIMNPDGSLAPGYTEADMANIAGQVFVSMYSAEVMTVNIGTNYSYTSGFEDGMTDDEKTASTYTVEAVNYNPDYAMGISEDTANKNEEFLWCANIREDITTLPLTAETPAEDADKVPCTAQDNGHTYTYNADEGVYICDACHLHARNILAADENSDLTMYAETTSGMSEDFVGQYGEEGMSTTTEAVNPAREAAMLESGDIVVVSTPKEGVLKRATSLSYLNETTGETITVSTKNEAGELVLSKSVTDPVTISAVYEDVYSITLDADENAVVEIEGDKTVASEGEIVSFTATGADGYAVTSVTVTYEAPVETTPEETTPEETVPEETTPEETTPEETTPEETTPEETTPDETVPEETTEPTEPATETKTDVLTANAEGIYSFEMPAANVTIKVEAEKLYNVSVTAPDATTGSISADKTQAIAGETVKLTVAPADGYGAKSVVVSYVVTTTVTNEDGTTTEQSKTEFVEVNDDYSFTMPAADVTVTVTFEKNYTVSAAESVVNGTITAVPAKTFAGDDVTVTVAPNDGYSISGVTANYTDAEGAARTIIATAVEGKENTYTFKMPAADVSVSAVFTPITYFIQTEGAVTLEGADPVEGSANTYSAAYGETIKVTAEQPEGHTTVVEVMAGDTAIGLAEDGTFTMPASDVKITVTSTVNSYTITTDGNVTLTGAEPIEAVDTFTAPYGTNITVELSENVAGGTLVIDGAEATANEDGTYTFRMPANSVHINVQPAAAPTVYAVEVSETENGTVTANVNEAEEGDTVTQTVTPDEGYVLSEIHVWNGTEEIVCTSADGQYSFKMPAGKVTITATFVAASAEPDPQA